jgi:small subunit ribosomal protein S17
MESNMQRNRRKTRIGKVVSDKMDNSVVVEIEWRQNHRLYSKSVKKFTKLHADDSSNLSSVGDVVSIMETRPLSKTKRWRVTEVISSTNLDGTGTIGPLNETVEIDNLEAEASDSQEAATPENIEEDSSEQ